jgi:uncharacterized protein YlzI (FlbEa/FlbD family)
LGIPTFKVMIGYPIHTRISMSRPIFIHVTEFHEPKRPMRLNASYILSFWETGNHTQIMLSTGDVLVVAESVDAVSRLIPCIVDDIISYPPND